MDIMKPAAKSDTERQILAAASELLEEKGEKGLTARAVCAMVKVKQPTLYHYFGSKDGLLQALTMHGITDFIAFKQSRGDVADPIQGLLLGWRAFLDYSALRPQHMRMIHRTLSHCPDATRAAMQTAREKLVRLQDEGRLLVNPDTAIDMMLLVAHGTLALWTSGKSIDEVGPSATLMFEAALGRIIADYKPGPVETGPVLVSEMA